MQKQPLNVIVGSVIQDGKCLLIRRIKEPYKNFWSLVGGKLEYGEDVRHAIEREFKEETALTIRFLDVRGVVSEVIRGNTSDTAENHFLIWVCGCAYVGGAAVERKEGVLAWFSEAELDSRKAEIIPSDYLMLKRFFFSETAPPSFHAVLMRSHGNGEYHIEYTDL